MVQMPLRRDGSFLLLGRDPRVDGPPTPDAPVPDWIQADPRRIRRALERARSQNGGGWFVLGATRSLREKPQKFTVVGRDLVAWMGPDGPRVAPDACPHMGASLSCGGRVDADGHILCPWHGLPLGARKHGVWAPLLAHDDGVLTWVRLDAELAPGESPTASPILPPRPSNFLDAVIRVEARCAPEDVLANRLDPWHGAHFHPHSFGRLHVVGEDDDSITVRVIYRIGGRLGMEVDARFHCPDPRTIVMTIVGGEGVGSVVETHATPIDEGRTAVIEATLATSERLPSLSKAPAFVRDLVAQRAARLWGEDAEYCERTYALRKQRQDRRLLRVLDATEELDAE